MTDQLHVRTFAAELDFTEGRLFGRLVPFDVSMPVADELPSGGLDTYLEGFRPGAFLRQVASTEPGVLRRVGLKHDHVGGLGYLGPLVEAEERSDGLYGEFRVLPSRRHDVAELVGLGVGELSIEFVERKDGTEVDAAGIRWRTDVRLGDVALLPQGAYGAAGAKVLAMRDLDEVIAEKAEEERLERERVEAEQAEQAEHERRRQLIAELDEFLDGAKARQLELAERFA